jgi:low temperature requirement protein LtrA
MQPEREEPGPGEPERATSRPAEAEAEPDGVRVSTIELFSDLVFVFAITQLTTVLVHDRGIAGFGRVLLMFGVIWWMYGGYIWLTNAVPPDGPVRRLLLLVAMAGFLMIGLAIPGAFDGDGVVFGLGYLVVVLVHTGLFTQAAQASTFRRIVRVAPVNLTSAVLIIIAGALGGTAEPILWAAALGLQVVSPLLTRTSGFRIQPGHFVERYGLLVLIVLGESVVAVGAGGAAGALDTASVGTSVLGLALTAALWWVYFAGDNDRAEEVLRATPPERRPGRALHAFFYAQIPMLLGVVAIAAGVETILTHPTAAASAHEAWLLGAGTAAYLAGDVWFRVALAIPRSSFRAAAGVVALATVPVGTQGAGVAQLAVLFVVLAGALALELHSVSVRPA